MSSYYRPIAVMTLGLLIAGANLFGDDGQTQPSQQYLQDDVQYFPGSNARQKAAWGERSGVVGDLLFFDVASVHFIGPGHPANPDGSFVGLVASDNAQIKIFERYIALQATAADGSVIRTLHAYEKIGKIEQRMPSPNTKTK